MTSVGGYEWPADTKSWGQKTGAKKAIYQEVVKFSSHVSMTPEMVHGTNSKIYIETKLLYFQCH